MISELLYKLYAINVNRLRNTIIRIVRKTEGGDLFSTTLRKIYKDYHKVEIGMYSGGGCFVSYQVDKFTKIGRYCSFAMSMRIFNRNHPMDFKSMHAFFFNPTFGHCTEDPIEYIPLAIGNDVWIGHNAVILPSVRSIGDGAVIGAGAVVNKDMPPYAVAVGNPARIVRYRFSKDIIEKLLESHWWEKAIEEIEPDIAEFQRPYVQGRNKDII